MLDKILKYYHTLKHLKWIQIKYQLWYRLKLMPSYAKRVNRTKHKQLLTKQKLNLLDALPSQISWLGENTFQFLNIRHPFKNDVDWNYKEYGKLWTYNLTYFEFLAQKNILKKEGLRLIHDFIKNEQNIKDGMEPFPISLRLLFWIKFLVKNNINEAKIDQSMRCQLNHLSAMPEYHLLGNHLLENGFSLLFGGYYFKDKKIVNQAITILTHQLQEQILKDGGHFELSPMYHQIMLYRLLDCINLLQNNSFPSMKTEDLLKILHQKATKMLGWMKEMTFSNGDMPCLNDSVDGIAPTSEALLNYANRLHVFPEKVFLKDSGYRKFSNKKYEIILDIGKIGPSYIPGHAHSDTFNFTLYHKKRPFIVDTGISTYEKNARRNVERSTSSHNTVMIGNQEQSEVWGGFRVAKRAEASILEETANHIKVVHNGYRKIRSSHQRNFLLEEHSVLIKDLITGDKSGIAFLHFHPDIEVALNNQLIYGASWQIQFDESSTVSLVPYFFAQGFNETRKSLKAVIHFTSKLDTIIQFN